MQFNVDNDYKYAKDITPNELNEAHKKICEALIELRAKKGHDYGQCFEFSMADYGLLSPIIRFRDKLGRLENLIKVKEAKVKDESIRDTILDLGNYCLLTCAVLDLIEQHKKYNSSCENTNKCIVGIKTTTNENITNSDYLSELNQKQPIESYMKDSNKNYNEK